MQDGYVLWRCEMDTRVGFFLRVRFRLRYSIKNHY